MLPLNTGYTPANLSKEIKQPLKTSLYFSSAPSSSPDEKGEKIDISLRKAFKNSWNNLNIKERFTSFFSKENLSYGLKKALSVIPYMSKEKNSTLIILLEAMGIALDSFIDFSLLGAPILIKMIFPNVAVSKTFRTFYEGVHEAGWGDDE